MRLRHRILVVGLAACALFAGPARAQSDAEKEASSLHCTSAPESWLCYGSMDVKMTMADEELRKYMSGFRFHVVRFSNREVLIEEEVPDDNQPTTTIVGTFLLAEPSDVAVSDNWRRWKTPDRLALSAVEQMASFCRMLDAAFPGGPKRIGVGTGEQTAISKMRDDVYPYDPNLEGKAVTVSRTKDATIHFHYRSGGNGRPFVDVSGTWTAIQPQPWPDAHAAPGSDAETGRTFRNLGEARAAQR